MGVQVDRGWELLDTKVVEESGHTFVETIVRRAFPGESTTPADRKALGEVDFSDEPVNKAYETQVVCSEYLVAADGARSTVRHKLNINFPGRTRSHKTIMWDGIYECDMDLAGITFVHGVNNRTLSSFPLTNGTRRLMADAGDIEPGEDISKTLQELTPEKFEKLANDCIAPARLKIKETSWLTIFKTNERRAESYIHKNRIFLAGDSVHVQSPAGGQGMNVGWHDAHNLAWKLAFVMNKIAPEALLETYQEREAMADKAIALATKLIDLERGTGVFTMIMMRIIYALEPYMFALMEALGFEEETHMVDVHYKENALNKAHPTQAIPAASYQVGVRAQDGTLRPMRADIEGTQNPAPTRLHELIAGIGRFHIVVFASDMISSRTGTHTATAIKGISTTTVKELERNIADYLSIWRSKWSYASILKDGYNDKDLFKVHVIAGPAVLDDRKESADSNGSSSSISALSDKRMGDGRIYLDDTMVLHKRYGFVSSRGAGGIVVIRPDSHIGYRVNGAGEQAWKDVQDYLSSILTQ